METRTRLSLAGTWLFQIDPQGSLTVDTITPDQSLQVPGAWQAAFQELEQYTGWGWYQREFEVPREFLNRSVVLHFEAVDYWCQVFVNKQLVGSHEGGYLPFSFPITKYLQSGKNELVVQVYDAAQQEIVIPRWRKERPNEETNVPPFDAGSLLHGKQEWYINVGGIWQEVFLECRSPTNLSLLHVTPNIETGEVRFEVELDGELGLTTSATLQLMVTDNKGTTWQNIVPINPGVRTYSGRVEVDDRILWSLTNPYLYQATATLIVGNDALDELSSRFGFREITTKEGKLYLNREPLYLLSALDQDFYPDTIYTPPSEEYLRKQFQQAKELGINCLRCHIKPPVPMYLDIADEMGILIWEEIPSWRTFYVKGTRFRSQLHLDSGTKAKVEQTLRELIRRDYNHPSLIIWTLVNEDWGTTLPLSSQDRAWVGELFQLCKGLDHTRLVVDNSPCPHPWGPNVHVKSDIDDFHYYANIPDQAEHFEHTAEQFNLRPLWTYSCHGESSRTGTEPLVLSEFGNWGLPSVKKLREPYGKDPGWFELGPWWSPWEGEPGWPKGVEERFNSLGFSTLWESYEHFAEATQWHQYQALKFQIEVMRRQPNFAGYVVTEFTDAYWESNGLLDFHRNPKVFHTKFAEINAPDVLVPQVKRYVAWDDDSLQVTLHIAHYGEKEWGKNDCSLHWDVDNGKETGTLALEQLERGTVTALAPKQFTLPVVQHTTPVKVQFSLSLQDDSVPVTNELEILVLPSSYRDATLTQEITVIERALHEPPSQGALQTSAVIPHPAPDQGELDVIDHHALEGQKLERRLFKLGYRTSKKLQGDADLVVTNYPNEQLLQWVRDGGKMLFISRGPSPFFWVQSRSGIYSGNWITSFSWIRTEIHKRVTVANPLGLPFKQIMPLGTILGLPVENPRYHRDFLSGMVAGWINHSAVHTVQFRYGKGKVIMTTFALEEYIGRDPMATAMLHDLLEYLASDRCTPELSANF